jgi:site-specific recombinase XerD
MYASGMRAQEVCNMTVSDITFNSDKASIKVLGKGRKMRRIGIPTQASNLF